MVLPTGESYTTHNTQFCNPQPSRYPSCRLFHNFQRPRRSRPKLASPSGEDTASRGRGLSLRGLQSGSMGSNLSPTPDTTGQRRSLNFTHLSLSSSLLLLRLFFFYLFFFSPPSRPLSAAWQLWLGGRVFPLFISEKMDSGKRLLKPLPTLPQLMGVIHLCPFLPDKALLED